MTQISGFFSFLVLAILFSTSLAWAGVPQIEVLDCALSAGLRAGMNEPTALEVYENILPNSPAGDVTGTLVLHNSETGVPPKLLLPVQLEPTTGTLFSLDYEIDNPITGMSTNYHLAVLGEGDDATLTLKLTGGHCILTYVCQNLTK